MVWTGSGTTVLAPSLKALFKQADIIHPGRPTASDGTIGDADHSARASDHNPRLYKDGKKYVTAGDLTDWDPRFDVDAAIERLRIDRDPRIKYAISDGRFFSSYATRSRRAWEWAKYDGVNGHFMHLHISVVFNDIGLFDTSSWFPPAQTPPSIKPPFIREDDIMIFAVTDLDRSFVAMPDGLVRLTEAEFWELAGGGMKVVPIKDATFVKLHSGKRVVSFNDDPVMGG